MTAIRVRGIDSDEESRVMLVDGKTPAGLARELCENRWKYVLLDRDGHSVGGVQLDVKLLKRTWWGEAE